jgi:hypothetical protein
MSSYHDKNLNHSYLKYIKYKNKYLTLKNQLGGTNIPRFSSLQFNQSLLIDDIFTSEYALSEKIAVEPPTYDQYFDLVSGNYKLVSLFNKDYYLANLNKFNEKANTLLFVTNDGLLTNIDSNDKLRFVLLIAEPEKVNYVKERLETFSENNVGILIGMFSGQYSPDYIRNKTTTRLMMLLGYFFTYWPIDIYGFICRQQYISNQLYVNNPTPIMKFTSFCKEFEIVLMNSIPEHPGKFSKAFKWYLSFARKQKVLEVGDSGFN